MADVCPGGSSSVGVHGGFKHLALDAVATFVLAACISIAWSYRADVELVLGARFVLTLVSVWCFLLAVFIAARVALSCRLARQEATGQSDGLSAAGRRGDAGARSSVVSRCFAALFDSARPLRSLVAVALVIGVLWAPYLVAMAPGNMNYDTTGQIAQFFSLMGWGEPYQLSDHHPAFVTFVYGSVIYACEVLFSHARLGVLILVLLQTCATALAFSAALVVAVSRWRVPRGLAFALALWSGLFPLIPLAVCSLSKDSFFSWVFVLFVLCVAELARTRGAVLSSLRFVGGFVLVCALMALTKKFGVYVVAATVLCALFVCGRPWRNMVRLGAPLVLAGLLSWCLVSSLVVSLGGIPGGKQEMLSVPIQQVALVYVEHGEELSEKDRAAIDGLLECDTLAERYSPWTVDDAKKVAKGKPDDAYRTFLATWIELGVRYPGSYFDAWAALDSPLFAGAPYEPIFSSGSHIENNGYVPDSLFEKGSERTLISGMISDWYYEAIEVPVVGQLLKLRTWGVIVPAFFVVAMLHARQRRQLFLAFVPVVALFGSLLLGPVTWGAEASRYVMPFVYAAPFMVAFSRFALTKCKVGSEGFAGRRPSFCG